MPGRLHSMWRKQTFKTSPIRGALPVSSARELAIPISEPIVVLHTVTTRLSLHRDPSFSLTC